MGLFRFLIRQLKHFSRYNKIFRVLFKYGFDDYASQFKNKKGFVFAKLFVSKTRVKRANMFSKWERMRMVCEELGPTFVKFGQVLSSRRDLLPEELIIELTKLQDAVPPFSGKIAKKILEDEFNGFNSEEIEYFNIEPFASASMAQVHRGRLKDGHEVVFKIQRQNIRKTIEEDIQIMRDLAKILSERMPSIKHFDPEGLVEQFANSIQFELDFIHESINLKRFDYNFRENPHIHAPKVYDNFTSTKVITMEFVAGAKPSVAKTKDIEVVTKRIADSFFKQVFEHGFFHADPHAGNIIVNPNGDIYFIDFGMMGTILKKDVEHIGNMLIAIESQDVKMLMNSISYLTNVVVFENRKRLEYELVEYINKYAFTKDFHLQVSSMLTDLIEVISVHNLTIPSHFFLLTRAMFSIEGLIRDLNPKIVLMDELKPIVQKQIMAQRNPVATGEKILNSMYDLGNYLEEFPSDLRQTMKLVRRGKLKVNMQHEGMDPSVKALVKIGRKLINTMIVSAIFIIASVFVLADTDPKWKGIPVYTFVTVGIGILVWIIASIKMNSQDYNK